jgi:succinate dehydrogenase / fumarate reductase, cytochrome b subunit
MREIGRQSTLGRAIKWFDPRARTINMLGFILNRVTALGLTLYLFLHLAVLSQLASGPEGYDTFVKTMHNPLFTFMEVLVVAAGLGHGLNGVRIFLNSLGIGVRYQKLLLLGVLALAGAVTLVFAIRMFGVE